MFSYFQLSNYFFLHLFFCSVKFTEELEDIEDGDLCSSPPSYTEEVHQTDRDSREEKTVLPSSTEQMYDIL